ncbi:MAG: hypothetical protein IJM55_09965 [Ruminococcus sp.]|nr:hypothetical protein [Ruminococcus sp.]
MIDRDRIVYVQTLVYDMMQKYQNEYFNLKNNLSLDCEEKFWCKGWREAYAPDFVNELADNTQETRKILPKEPRKKSYTSLHYYLKREPVFSLFYGFEEEPCMEKFFVETDNMIVGICYSTDNGNIYSLSIEIRNENGLPYEYIVCYMDMNNKHDRFPSYLLRVSTYKYDNQNHIISASYIDGSQISVSTDNDFASTAPECLEDYIFLYENGTVANFTRVNYTANYEKKAENTWKFNKWILKRYKDDGINYFG